MAGILLAFEIYNFIYPPDATSLSFDIGFFLIDMVAAVALIVIAVRANRIYTLWLAGLQIIAVFAHLARGLSEAISTIAYVVMFSGPSYFQIIILGSGIWLHYRREQRHGNYRSWRTFSARSSEAEPMP